MKSKKLPFNMEVYGTKPLMLSFSLIIFLIITGFKNNPIFITSEYLNETKNLIQPDSIYPDSLYYQMGDTTSYYLSGADTVYILFEDTTLEDMDNGWVVTHPSHMITEFTHHYAPINEGVNGLNLSDLFEPGHGNFDDNGNYTLGVNPWLAIEALSPKTIRVFSGAGSKFMHLLGSDAGGGLKNGGYGYDIQEIVQYYNISDNDDDDPLWSLIVADFETDINPGVCDNCPSWMDGRYVADFTDFYYKWKSQPIYNPGDYVIFSGQEDEPLYINQLLTLVEGIEDANTAEGYFVDIILCLNILSERASVCKQIIEYLINNNLYDVHVAGVEMGNEVYFNYGEDLMGFIGFDEYWEYINGGNYTGAAQTDLFFVLPDEMEDDHDFIEELKGDPNFEEVKIGLPAENLPNCGVEYDYALMPVGERPHTAPILGDGAGEADDPCPCGYPDWNVDMVDYYSETVTAGEGTRYAFDAIVFHTYYNPDNSSTACLENSNWRDIMLSLQPNYDPGDPDDITIADYTYTSGEWDYILEAPAPPNPSTPDSRLIDAFNGIAGVHHQTTTSDLLTGNFRDFIRTRIDNSFEEHAIQMLFTDNDEEPENKEVWITEYNLHETKERRFIYH